MKAVRLGALVLGGSLFSMACLAAGPNAPVAAAVAPPPARDALNRLAPIEKTASGVFRVGEVLVNKAERSISFPAEVNMDSGMLEYLLVHRRGKTHESLLRTVVDPYNLQVAFLLLGFEGTEKRLTRQGDSETPSGEAVRITITSDVGARKTVIPVENWLTNKFSGAAKDVESLNWVYTGSFVFQGRFMSQESGSIVAIWHDPVALIDNASPGGASNAIWFVKQGTVPAVGTPVEVTITPTK